MSYKNLVTALPVSTIDGATFNNTFQLVNGTGFAFPCFLMRIVNDSNRVIIVSFDGVNGCDAISAGQTLQITTQGNSIPHNPDVAKFPARMRVYVKGATAGAGLVYVTGYYQLQT